MSSQEKHTPGGYIVALIVPADTRVCAGPVRIVWPDSQVTTAAEVHSAHFEDPDAFARRMEVHDEILAALAELEWTGTTDLPGGGTGACCPECEGIAPDVRLPSWAQDYHGHVHDCQLASAIARATGQEAPDA